MSDPQQQAKRVEVNHPCPECGRRIERAGVLGFDREAVDEVHINACLIDESEVATDWHGETVVAHHSQN